jgi:hypothetical protein
MAISEVAKEVPGVVGTGGMIFFIAAVSLVLILFLTIRIIDLSRKMKKHQEYKNIKSLKFRMTLQIIMAVSIALGAEISIALLLTNG